MLVCLPVFNTVAGYRYEHLEHHQQSGARDDPYHELYGQYSRPRDVWLGLLRDLSGLSAIRAFLRRYSAKGGEPKRSGGKGDLFALLAVQGAIGAGLWALTGSPLAWGFLWVLPLMTIPLTVNRVRTFVEHFALPGGPPANRTTPTGLLDYLCVAPYGYSHHFAHHLAPMIPYYRLAWAHRFLQSRGAGVLPHECNRAGYLRSFGVMMREFASGKARAA